MWNRFALAAGLAAILVPGMVRAQENVQPYSLGVYYQCDVTRGDRADEIVQGVLGPILDHHMSAGHVTAWGWLAHNAGGRWRKVSYFVAPDLDVLLETRDAVLQEALNDHGEEWREFASICPRHEDYIWQNVAGSQAPEELAASRPAAGISTYYECDVAHEGRADEIVEKVFAPVYDRHVAAGDIASWGWLSHVAGGRVRRLATLNGADHASLLKVWGQIIEEVNEETPGLSQAFSEICGTHNDYLWDTVASKP